MRFKILVPALVIISALAASAQNATTVPVGAVTVTIPAAVGGVPKTSLISFPLISKAEIAGAQTGRITSITQNTLSNSSAGWTAGQLSAAATPHLLRITSGAAKGLSLPISTATPNTSTTVTIDAEEDALIDLSTLGIQLGVSSGDTYEIVTCDTLRSLFGDTSDGVVGSATPTGADIAMIMVSGAWRKYYFNTNLDSWRQVGSDSFADNVIVRPDAAVVYTRVGASDLKLTLMGEVPSRERRFVLRSSATTPVSSYYRLTVAQSHCQKSRSKSPFERLR